MMTAPNYLIHSDSSNAAKVAAAFALLVDVSRGFVNNLLAQFVSVLCIPLIIVVYFIWNKLNIKITAHTKILLNDFEHGGPKYAAAMKDFSGVKHQDSKMSIRYRTVKCPIGLYILVAPFKRSIQLMIDYRNQLCIIANKRNDTLKDDFFKHLNSKTLWDDRTKAYEYLM